MARCSARAHSLFGGCKVNRLDRTIEGLSGRGASQNPVQRPWARDVPQWWLVASLVRSWAAAALLRKTPKPTDKDIDEADYQYLPLRHLSAAHPRGPLPWRPGRYHRPFGRFSPEQIGLEQYGRSLSNAGLDKTVFWKEKKTRALSRRTFIDRPRPAVAGGGLCARAKRFRSGSEKRRRKARRQRPNSHLWSRIKPTILVIRVARLEMGQGTNYGPGPAGRRSTRNWRCG